MDKLIIQLNQDTEKLRKFIHHDLPIKIGKQAVDLFKENFQKEGFFGDKWKEVKRRSDPRIKGARSTRKILTGNTGDLGRSIRYTPQDAQVLIYSDLKYAAAHNEGTTTAGRGNSTTIPQRKFIDESRELDDMVKREMDKFFDSLK